MFIFAHGQGQFGAWELLTNIKDNNNYNYLLQSSTIAFVEDVDQDFYHNRVDKANLDVHQKESKLAIAVGGKDSRDYANAQQFILYDTISQQVKG